uniref:SigE family RNA polymerase sigma factor n=1 Tax=Nonomuraea bangladeshensis TaxID=404385 RepID=UPI003F491466
MRDRADYIAYVEARSPRLLRAAYLLCRDWAHAEDLVQTALAKVWRVWRRVDSQPDPYVYRVLVNTHTSWRGRRWHGEIPTDQLPDIADATDPMGAADTRATLWAALGRLPPRQRAVVVLRYFEDLPEHLIAEIMDCSVGTVKSQTSKALAKLRIDPELASTTHAVEDPS